MITKNKTMFGYGALLLLALILSIWNPLVDKASGYNTQISLSGAVIYASLRGVVSAMSFVQDADIQVAVPFASITGSPGQALQPVISTLERMANLLFALVLASGVLTVALPAVAGLGSFALIAGTLAAGASHIVGAGWPTTIRRGAHACIQLGVLAVIVIPAAYALSFVIGDRMTAEAWNRASSVFNQQAAELEGTVVPDGPVAQTGETLIAGEESATADEGGGFFDWVRREIGGAVQGSGEAIQIAMSSTVNFAGAVTDQVANNAKVIENGVAMAGSLFQASIEIGVAYLIKLVVLPAVIIFAFVWVIRGMRRPM